VGADCLVPATRATVEVTGLALGTKAQISDCPSFNQLSSSDGSQRVCEASAKNTEALSVIVLARVVEGMIDP
jgi:hypothetical protein